MGYQERMVLENLRDPEWERKWDHAFEMREAPKMAAQMGLYMARLESQHWESHWGKEVEGR